MEINVNLPGIFRGYVNDGKKITDQNGDTVRKRPTLNIKRVINIYCVLSDCRLGRGFTEGHYCSSKCMDFGRNYGADLVARTATPDSSFQTRSKVPPKSIKPLCKNKSSQEISGTTFSTNTIESYDFAKNIEVSPLYDRYMADFNTRSGEFMLVGDFTLVLQQVRNDENAVEAPSKSDFFANQVHQNPSLTQLRQRMAQRDWIVLFSHPKQLQMGISAIYSVISAVYTMVRPRIDISMVEHVDQFVIYMKKAVELNPMDSLTVGSSYLTRIVRYIRSSDLVRMNEMFSGSMIVKLGNGKYCTVEPQSEIYLSFKEIPVIPFLSIYGSKLLQLRENIGKIAFEIGPKDEPHAKRIQSFVGTVFTAFFSGVFAPIEWDRNVFFNKFISFVETVAAKLSDMTSGNLEKTERSKAGNSQPMLCDIIMDLLKCEFNSAFGKEANTIITLNKNTLSSDT